MLQIRIVTECIPIPSSLDPLCYGMKGYSTQAFIVQHKHAYKMHLCGKFHAHSDFSKYSSFISGQTVPNLGELYCLMMSYVVS